jgi:hypothetical protein
MKSRWLMLIGVVALLVGALAVLGIGTAFAWGTGPQGSGLSGMMGGVGGMMGGGQGMMGGVYGQSSQNQGQPIGLDQAVKNVQSYVDQTGNKGLVVDEVMEFQNNYYAIVKEKNTGTGAFELLVNKATGQVFPEMGPNMMWNTKYGMHSAGSNGLYGGIQRMMSGQGGLMEGSAQGMMSGQYPVTAPSGPMTVTADQAKSLAQQWLDQNQKGSTTETPDQFYGYYTVHTLKDGKVSGMLSVNGYTGQVWYHSWHGNFVQARDLGQ